jgi:hypothetical protein
MAAIITPPCTMLAGCLSTPVCGWFVLSAAFDVSAAAIMAGHMRQYLIRSYGRNGRTGPLPMIGLGDGRWVIRFVARQVPQIVNADGLRLIVEPTRGSLVQIIADFHAMVAGVGLIPIMQEVRVVRLAETAARNQNSGVAG